VNQILRLRGNANSLHRAAHKSQETLDRLQQADAEPPPEDAVEDLPISAKTPDLVAFTRPVQISRQQRRAAERQAEKTRLRGLEEARRAERAARRDFAATGPLIPVPVQRDQHLPQRARPPCVTPRHVSRSKHG
jgi:hypothetical protein